MMWRSPPSLRLFPSVRHCPSLLLLLQHLPLLLLLMSRAAATPFNQWTPLDSSVPVFGTGPDTESVTVGDKAILKCEVNYNGNYKVLWTFNSNTLTFNERRVISDDRINIRRDPHSMHVWDLGIDDVRESDEGDYFCIVNSSPPQKRKVRLVIRVPPRITSIPMQQIETLPEDRSLRVDCDAQGRPEPTITWTRENAKRKTFSISTDKTQDLYVHGKRLVIAHAKRWMEGIFVCTASNGIYPPARKTVTLSVNYRPVVRFVNSRIGQQLGAVTMLQCKVESNPMGDVSWELNGRPLEPPPPTCTTVSTGQRICKEIYGMESDPYKAQVDLTIRNVTSIDYGDYACVATSTLGTTRAFANLYKITPNDVIVYMPRRYQNDAGRGLNSETPAPSTRKRVPETVLVQNTGKPHTSGRNSSGSRLHLSDFLQNVVVVVLLLLLRLPSS